MGLVSVSLAVLTTVLWGGTAVANLFAMDVLPPIFVGGVRFGFAAIFMVFWCLANRSPLLLKQTAWRPAVILGVLLFLQITLFNVGVFHSSASHASILVNSYIFWVAAYEHFFSRTARLRWWQISGLLLAAAGCSFLMLSTETTAGEASLDRPTLVGDLILALSGLTLGVKIVYTKRAVSTIPPGTLILWHDVIGTALFFACSFAVESPTNEPVTLPAWLALLYGGVMVSGFCFAVNAVLLRRHGASHVSVFSFGTPIFGVALGVLLRGDQLSVWLAVAGLLVAIGIFLVNVVASPDSGS